MIQQYVNQELPDAQAGFRKGKGTRDQIVNICWSVEKASHCMQRLGQEQMIKLCFNANYKFWVFLSQRR